jgi:hypothetical protein
MNQFPKTFVLFIAALVSFYSAYSQSNYVRFGITANYGYSLGNPIPSYNDREPRRRNSGNLGITLEQKLTSRASLDVDVLWVQLEGSLINPYQALYTYDFSGAQGRQIGYMSTQTLYHLTYLGVPVQCRYKIGRLGLKAGGQTLFYIYGSSDYSGHGVYDKKPYNPTRHDKNLHFNRLNYGPIVGIDVEVTRWLRLKADYFRGIKTKWKFYDHMNTMQATVGVDIRIGRIKNEYRSDDEE